MTRDEFNKEFNYRPADDCAYCIYSVKRQEQEKNCIWIVLKCAHPKRSKEERVFEDHSCKAFEAVHD